MYIYIYMYMYIYIWGIYGSESKPRARWPARTSLCYIPLKRGACYIPLVARCRAIIKDLELEGLSRQARTCYIPLVTGYVACVGPGLVTSLWF